MSSSLSKLGRWLARKLVMTVVVTAAGFATYGLCLYVHDTGEYGRSRGALAAQWAEAKVTTAALEAEVAGLQAAITAQQQRVDMAMRVIATLRDLQSTWDRFVGNPAQQQANDDQRRRMKAIKRTANDEVRRLRSEFFVKGRTLAVAKADLVRTDRTLTDLDHGRAAWVHYLREAWFLGRGYVALLLAVYLLGPTLVCVWLYYGLAPLIVRGRPVRLRGEPVAVVKAEASRATVESALWPGEVMWVKKSVSLTMEGGLMRKTRGLLSWRFPFASIAGGLANLTELRNVRSDGGRRVTLDRNGPAGTADGFTGVDVPEGGSLVLRPAFLVSVISPAAERLVIRRHWQWVRWQSWVAGQFCFFEIMGPCRLVLAGGGGLRMERLLERADGLMPAVRVRQAEVVAFTPNLEGRPVRAVSFWRYYCEGTPLFEAGFSGPGLVVLATVPRRRIRRVFGL